MKKKILSILIILSIIFSVCSVAFAKTSVRGYTKKNGTYVSPHYRSDRDYKFNNNWSTKGNMNPYTGKKGYKIRR